MIGKLKGNHRMNQKGYRLSMKENNKKIKIYYQVEWKYNIHLYSSRKLKINPLYLISLTKKRDVDVH